MPKHQWVLGERHMLCRINKFTGLLSLVVLLGVISVSPICAANTEKNVVSETIRDVWGAPNEQKTGFNHTLTTGCVGNSLPGCAAYPNWSNDGATVNGFTNRGATQNDAAATLMLVAKTIGTNGAEFCVTQVDTANTDEATDMTHCTGNATTWYYYPTGAESNCFWLCKDGFFDGDAGNCTSATPGEKTSLDLRRTMFDDYKIVTSGIDKDSEIPMFFRAKKISSSEGVCHDEEYDTILAVTRFLNSGNGMFVAPVAVRAHAKYFHKWSSWGKTGYRFVSAPYMEKVGTETLLCKNGFEHNPSHTDCVDATTEIAKQMRTAAAELEKIQNLQACDIKWVGFDASQHTKCGGKYNEQDAKQCMDITELKNAECYTYRCTDTTKAFRSASDHTCVTCTGEKERITEDGFCETVPPCSSLYAHYDNTKHKIRKVNEAGKWCFKYQCNNITQGFNSESDHSCVDCLGDNRKISVANSGLCVQCPIGSIIDSAVITGDASGDYCKAVSQDNQFNKDKLLYGKDGRPGNKIGNQCWTFTQDDEYKTCVKEGAEAAKQKALLRLTQNTSNK